MASLQARHTRACASGKPWTPAAAAGTGCTCVGGPTYYVVVREGRRLLREKAGKNRQHAERALRKIGTRVDDGSYELQRRIKFEAWADHWLAGLERKENTARGYRSSLTYAKAAFGERIVRTLGIEDVKRMLQRMREEERAADGKPTKRKLSDSTRAKHLRVLGACLESAVIAGYAGRNPVRLLPRGERPRPAKKEAAYFEVDELPRLFKHVEDGIHRVLFLAALKTGMRLGELAALTWGDVDLVGAVIRVRRSYTDGFLSTPKNHERRDVDLTPELVELLGAWWGELGSPADDRLVFPGATKSGYLNPKQVLSALYDAMEAAEVPRVGPTGEKRTFHSWRHTHAKVALEQARSITWLQRRLGHQSITVTIDRYGHWERAARKREAELLEGAFGV